MRERTAGNQTAGKERWWLAGAAGAYLLTKVKALLPLLKAGSLGGSLLSMLVSIWAYTLVAPYQLAVGVVLLLLVHEFGHVWAARRKGLPLSAPIFIPFFGAMVNMKRHPRDAATESYIALGGPFIGTVGALSVFAVGWYGNSPLLVVIAYVGFLFNLLNLVPVYPLDGGKIAASVTRSLWPAGLLASLAAIVYFRLYPLAVLWVWLAWEWYRHLSSPRRKRQLRSTWASFAVSHGSPGENPAVLAAPQVPVPLNYTTYSELNGKQKILLSAPELGLRGLLSLPEQGTLAAVQAVKMETRRRRDGLTSIIRCRVDYQLHENDAYYDVPRAIRWTYGIVYGLLAVVLGLLVYLCSAIAMPKYL